jgi:hypothetical protein
MSDICARSVIPPQQVLVHRRQPWRNRRRRHRARAARSMVDTAQRASTSRHCPKSALVPPNDDSEYWYIVGKLGADGGGATAHGLRHRWSHSFARHNGSTMSDKCGRPATRYWPVVVHHRQCCGRRRRRWHVSSATTTRFGSSVSTMPNICTRHGDGGFQTATLD